MSISYVTALSTSLVMAFKGQYISTVIPRLTGDLANEFFG